EDGREHRIDGAPHPGRVLDPLKVAGPAHPVTWDQSGKVLVERDAGRRGRLEVVIPDDVSVSGLVQREAVMGPEAGGVGPGVPRLHLDADGLDPGCGAGRPGELEVHLFRRVRFRCSRFLGVGSRDGAGEQKEAVEAHQSPGWWWSADTLLLTVSARARGCGRIASF